MLMREIIIKKRDGFSLTREELHFTIQGYVSGLVPDYQMSAFCMAIKFIGMNEIETSILTDEMMHSGGTIDLSSIKGIKSDKHSTGGVGDKTSLALGPLVAACGVKVAKMSGRGLGHTGGTIDKLEAIPGLSVSLSPKQFVDQVNKIGIAIIGQTAELVPADKKMYSLRDVTGTIESLPLIASSIMSKKLASGADTILLDVKFGGGAFMKTIDDARLLAQTMVSIGNALGKDTRAILTDMDQPLGLAVGNSLEVIEAIETLKGRGPVDFVELCLQAGAIMLGQASIEKDPKKARKMLEKVISNGEGLAKLKAMVSAQGGDVAYIDNVSLFPKSATRIEVKATANGFVKYINAQLIGESAMHLGAGRAKKEDVIDFAAGIVLNKKIGHKVKIGDLLATLYTNKTDYQQVIRDVEDCFVLSNEPVTPNPIVYEVIS